MKSKSELNFQIVRLADQTSSTKGNIPPYILCGFPHFCTIIALALGCIESSNNILNNQVPLFAVFTILIRNKEKPYMH
jgi:hypothetical protein